jgi:hypothetical protein
VSNVQKKVQKKFKKKLEKKLENWKRWRIVIPMAEAINFVDGRRQQNPLQTQKSKKPRRLLIVSEKQD